MKPGVMGITVSSGFAIKFFETYKSGNAGRLMPLVVALRCRKQQR